MFLNNPLGYKQKDLEYDRGLLLMAVPYKKCAILTKSPYKKCKDWLKSRYRKCKLKLERGDKSETVSYG